MKIRVFNMAAKENGVQKSKVKHVEEEVEPTPPADPEAQARQESLSEDVDDLLDEIDDVLEENAETFVAQYVQKGGE